MNNNQPKGSETENVSVTVRIDPKLNYILDIICKIDRVSKNDIIERAFWGDDEPNGHVFNQDYEPDQNRVEEPKKIVDYISNYKVNISARIDKKLNDIITEGADRQGMTKVAIIENALWEYVEKEGFERDPVTEKIIKVTIDLPGRFKNYIEIAE